MIIRRKIDYSDLSKLGLVQTDITEIIQRPDGTTELKFVDPAKEATMLSETAAIAAADTLIDAITNLADAKAFLRKLCKRLIANGSLP